MKLKLKEFVKIYGDYDVEFTVVGSETGAVEFIKLSKPKPKPTLTEDEKVILRNLPIEYKGYIARYRDTHCDGFSILIACKTKPIKDNDLGVWSSNNDFTNLPYDHLFQFITWEDEEPYNIEELLKGNELC